MRLVVGPLVQRAAAASIIAAAIVLVYPPSSAQTPAMGVKAGSRAQILLGKDVTPSLVQHRTEYLLAPQANLSSIVVNYSGFSAAAQVAFQAAVNIWQMEVQSNVTIVVNAQWTNLNSINPNILGQAGPVQITHDFPGAIRSNTWYPIAIANRFAGFDLLPGIGDIDAEFNSGFVNWYFGTDGHPPAGQVDFMSVVLHELGHGLGFLGSMDASSPGDGNWGGGTGFPFIYDWFAVNGSLTPLLNFPNHSAALAAQLTSNSVFFNGPNTTAANGGHAARLYAPATWQPGSSYSHLDEATYGVGNPNSLMTPVLNYGEAIHDPGPITRGTFIDVGWTVAVPCTYTLSSSSITVAESGTGAGVNVTAPVNCPWTATNNAGFITVTGGANGAGNGTVSFSVASNVGAANQTTPQRSGTLTIAGQTFTVIQTGCAYAIAPDDMTFTSQAGSSAVNISAPPACPWTVTNLPAWASTISGANGTGPGTWQYSVAGNAGVTRSQTVAAAGLSFVLTQLAASVKTMTPGTRGELDLANASDVQTASFEAVAGRSYCVSVARRRDALDNASPTVTILGPTLVPLAGGAPNTVRACLIAPSSEAILVQLTQSDATPRPHLLNIVETTLWANWFFIAGNYSSYTMLRNTTASPVHATLTWRSDTGAVAGTQTVTIAAGAVYYVDARATTAGATAGSVEIGHDGEPDALVGSQTTLAATTGLSFDTIMLRRLVRSR